MADVTLTPGPGEFVLLDAAAGVRFAATGELLELRSVERTWLLAPGCAGWSLRGPAGLLRPGPASRVTQVSPTQARVTYDHLVRPDGGPVAVTVEVDWSLRDGRLEGQLRRAELPAELRAVALAFPEVRLPHDGGAQVILPEDLGRLLDLPAAAQVAATGKPFERRSRVHLQLTAWLADGAGVYLDSRDAEGWVKALVIQLGDGVARLAFEHVLPQPAEGAPTCPDFPVSLAPLTGGWYQAARIYRAWALQQPWAARGPAERQGSYLAKIAGWVWNRGRIDNVCPATKEVARRLGLPIALDWYWWHKKPYDTGYPDYFPPREGEAKFKAAVADLQQHGVSVQVYTNGMSWEQSEEDWPTLGRQCTLVHANGEFWGHIYNTWMNRRLMHVCGAAPVWHERALRTADGAAALGLDGLYMDQIAIIGGQVPCHAATHGHVPGGGPYGTQGFRKLFETIHERHPNLVITSESLIEHYQDLLEGCITLQTSSERVNTIPLFAAVYHGRAIVFGIYTHLDGVTPYDELWPAEYRVDPARERDWLAICPDQFALAVARTVSLGCQPMATNLTLEQLHAPRLAADVEFFLDLCRFYHAHREWLLWGELLDPGTLRCEALEVTCIDRSIFTRPETIEPFTVTRPAVLHNAWRAPDGRAGLVLINYSRRSQTVSLERPDGLIPEGGATLELPARSARFVPLAKV